MKLVATIASTYESTWKIRISPSRTAIANGEDVYRFWTLPDTDEMMLIYDPSIALSIKGRESKKAILIPINLLQLVRNTLFTLYNKLNVKGVFNKMPNSNTIYVDQAISEKLQFKIALFHGTVLFYPSVNVRSDGTTDPGIRIQYADVNIFVKQDDIPFIHDILERLDVQNFAVMLTMLERLDRMDKKLDDMMYMINTILYRMDELSDVKIKPAPVKEHREQFPPMTIESGGLTWEQK